LFLYLEQDEIFTLKAKKNVTYNNEREKEKKVSSQSKEPALRMFLRVGEKNNPDYKY